MAFVAKNIIKMVTLDKFVKRRLLTLRLVDSDSYEKLASINSGSSFYFVAEKLQAVNKKIPILTLIVLIKPTVILLLSDSYCHLK